MKVKKANAKKKAARKISGSTSDDTLHDFGTKNRMSHAESPFVTTTNRSLSLLTEKPR